MRILFYAIWLILLMIFQPTLARGIDVWGIAPNLFLCFVVMMGFLRGKQEGAICGIVFGLFYDMLIGRLVGVNSLCYLYLGFGAGALSESFFSGGKRIAGVVYIAIGTIAAAIIYYLAQLMTGGNIGFATAIFRTALPEAMYNALIGIILPLPMVWLMKLLRIDRIS